MPIIKVTETKVYKFEELEDDAKEKAREWYREGALQGYDWWEYNYDSFKTLAGFFGFDVNLKKTYFTGFYHQGQGSSFEADVDIVKMFKCIQSESWKQEFPELNSLRFQPITKNMLRMIDMIEREFMYASGSVSNSNHETSVRASLDWDFNDPSGMRSYNRCDCVMREIEDYLQDVADELNNDLFNGLRDEHEWYLADEQVDESIISNEYEFLEDGSRA